MVATSQKASVHNSGGRLIALRCALNEAQPDGADAEQPPVRLATTTHVLRDLRSQASQRSDRVSLSPLRRARTQPAKPAIGGAASYHPTRPGIRTHNLKDLRVLFDSGDSTQRARRIRVCVVDTMLQTGGAEWFASQLATHANAAIFEFVFVTYNSSKSAIARSLGERGYRVICSSTWRNNVLTYSSWLDHDLFEILEQLRADVVFFSSQYLFEQLRENPRFAQFSVVVRISNFHANELATSDFDAATKVVCCTDEQFAVVSKSYPDKAVLIRTGVDLSLFSPPTPVEKDALKAQHRLSGKTVVLFVGRLGSPLKRLPVFQDVVRAVNRTRADVGYVVAGYFGATQADEERAFQEFVDAEGVTWLKDVPPWRMRPLYQMADILVSTSAEHEGLSNTVLQALASGVVPVVTPSAGMHELVIGGETGFVAPGLEHDEVVRVLVSAIDIGEDSRRALAARGRETVRSTFDLRECVLAYQQELLAVYRRRPARVCITDGTFGIGGAEWLAAQLIVTSDPAVVRFELIVHRKGSPLLQWLEEQGVVVHSAPAQMTYDEWRQHGIDETLRVLRPDILMPCTITTWPSRRPLCRLLAISQNAADADVLVEKQYEEADLFLCVSEEVRDRLSPRHREKMRVLRNSIDVELFSPKPGLRFSVRRELGIPDDAKVVLWCGRMHEPRKRLDVLMDVIAQMAPRSDIHFLVVGYFTPGASGHDEWLRFLAAYPNVSWTRGATPWEMPPYYWAADLYLSTSGFARADFEGLSLTSVQALAAQLPIVTTTSGGQREVVEDGRNGRLVDNGDVNGLVAAITGIVDAGPGTVARVRAANGKRALDRFDIRKHARTYGAMAQLLKNTVGPALTLQYGGGPLAGENGHGEIEEFVSFTWPMLPELDPRDTVPQTGVEPVIFSRSESGMSEPLPVLLRQMEERVVPGQWLVVRHVGPGVESNGSASDLSARELRELLQYLERRSPMWSACGRHGPHFLLQRA